MIKWRRERGTDRQETEEKQRSGIWARYKNGIIAWTSAAMLVASVGAMVRTEIAYRRSERNVAAINRIDKEQRELRERTILATDKITSMLPDIIKAQRIFGSQNFSEEDNQRIGEKLQEIFNMPVEQVATRLPRYEIVFTLFDWMRDRIKYVEYDSPISKVPKTPAEVIATLEADCDEGANLLGGMLTTIFDEPARVVLATGQKPDKGHAYLQFLLAPTDIRVPNQFEEMEKELIAAFQKHYKMSEHKARRYVLQGLEVDIDGVWFSLDTTAPYPGLNCRFLTQCQRIAIVYQR